MEDFQGQVSGTPETSQSLTTYQPKTGNIPTNSIALPQTFNTITITFVTAPVFGTLPSGVSLTLNDIGTAVQINTEAPLTSFMSPLVTEYCYIYVPNGNTGSVFVGPQGHVTFPLTKAQSTGNSTQYNFPKTDINSIFIKGTANGDQVFIIYGGCPSIGTFTESDVRVSSMAPELTRQDG